MVSTIRHLGDSASREEQAKKTIEVLKKTNNLLEENPPNLRSARSAFQATVNEEPTNVEIRRAFGCFLFGAGSKEDAKEQFQRALELDPLSAEVICSFSQLLIDGSSDSNPGPSKEDLSQAQSLLNRCLQSHPGKEYDVGMLSPRDRESASSAPQNPPVKPEESRGLHVTASGFEERKPGLEEEDSGAGVSVSREEEAQKAASGGEATRTAGERDRDGGGSDSDNSADEALGRLAGKDGKKKKRFFFCMPVPGL